MKRFLVVMAICSSIFLLLFAGCSQHDNIAIPQNMATITIKPYYLPEPDEAFIYELWMIKARPGSDILSAQEYTSLARFTWDYSIGRLFDANGAVIENSFDLPESWYNYDYIAVTVENRNDPDPESPSGVIMLVDAVADPATRPMVLKFPADLFGVTGFYFVGSPTDDTSYYDIAGDSVVRYSVNEGKGLWLCTRSFSEQPGNVQDTLGILPDSHGNDSVYCDISPELGTGDIIYEPDIIGIIHPPGGWPSVVEYDTMVLGYDSIFDHRRVEFVYIDTVDTNNNYTLRVAYDTLPGRTYGFFNYNKALENLPEIEPYGWRYNGWVILEQPDTAGGEDNSGMGLASVIPFGDGRLERFTGGKSWGVLPLGAFGDPGRPDLENPYNGNREVPQFPGNDFVKDASPRFEHLNLRRIADHSWGFVVLGMEPDPVRLNGPAEKNFPLFIMSGELLNGDAAAYSSDDPDDIVQAFHNWTQFLPRIEVAVEMHD